MGSDRLEITIAKKSDFEKALKVIDGEAMQIDPERRILSIATRGGVKELKQVLQHLEDKHVEVESVSLHRPTLDDVFLRLTGHTASKEADIQVQEKNK